MFTLRLIVSQMNALMNPHYITRLVCEEGGEGPQRGRQAGGLLYVHIEEVEEEEETDRCADRVFQK